MAVAHRAGSERGEALAEVYQHEFQGGQKRDHFDVRGEVGKKVVEERGGIEENVCCLGSIEVGTGLTETLVVKLIP